MALRGHAEAGRRIQALAAEWGRFRALRIASLARRGLASGVVRAIKADAKDVAAQNTDDAGPGGKSLRAVRFGPRDGDPAHQDGADSNMKGVDLAPANSAALGAALGSCGMDAVCEMRITVSNKSQPGPSAKDQPQSGVKRKKFEEADATVVVASAPSLDDMKASGSADDRIAVGGGLEAKRPRLVLERGGVFDGPGCLRFRCGSRKSGSGRTVSFSEQLELEPTYVYKN